MPKPPPPWDAIPPEKWRAMLALAFNADPFDPRDIGLDAGLSPVEIEALTAWCRHVEREEEARRALGAMSPSARRFLDEPDEPIAPGELDAIEDSIAALMASRTKLPRKR